MQRKRYAACAGDRARPPTGCDHHGIATDSASIGEDTADRTVLDDDFLYSDIFMDSDTSASRRLRVSHHDVGRIHAAIARYPKPSHQFLRIDDGQPFANAAGRQQFNVDSAGTASIWNRL